VSNMRRADVIVAQFYNGVAAASLLYGRQVARLTELVAECYNRSDGIRPSNFTSILLYQARTEIQSTNPLEAETSGFVAFRSSYCA